MRYLFFMCLSLLVPQLAMSADGPDNHSPVEMREDTDPPDQWRSMPLGDVDPQQRLVWIRKRVEIPASAVSSGVPFALHVFAPVSYEAWWNGTFIGRNGTPGNSAQSEIPGRLQSDILIPMHLLRPGKNELLMRVSSFHLPSRLNTPIQVVEVAEFGGTRYDSIRQNVFRLMTAGALLLAAVYFGALYFSNRRDVSSLLLALLSLSVLAQLLSESIRFLINYEYPFHIARVKLIAGFACSSMLLLVAYVGFRYSRAALSWLVSSAAVLAALSLALVPGYDGKSFTVMVVGFVTAGLSAALGVRTKAPGARIVLALIAASLALAFVNALCSSISRTTSRSRRCCSFFSASRSASCAGCSVRRCRPSCARPVWNWSSCASRSSRIS